MSNSKIWGRSQRNVVFKRRQGLNPVYVEGESVNEQKLYK